MRSWQVTSRSRIRHGQLSVWQPCLAVRWSKWMESWYCRVNDQITSTPADPPRTVRPGRPGGTTLADKLSRLGIADELDLLMHLPLRYEDETHLYPIRDVPENRIVQVEGVITHRDVMFRPRRQLVCRVD